MKNLPLSLALTCSLTQISPALAEPSKPATTACVNRENTEWRQVRDPILDAKSLQYCTGEDCWSLDFGTTLVSAAPKRPLAKRNRPKAGELGDQQGKPLATADETHVTFCLSGPSSCKSFNYKLANPAVNGVYPLVNDEHTLGAVMARGESEAKQPSFIFLFDLVQGKQIAKVQGREVSVLGHGFLIDETTFYSAAFKKLGKLAGADQAWERLGTSDRIAIHDVKKGGFVIQDAMTGKAQRLIPHNVADRAAWFKFVASPDGTKLYAIGSRTVEGEVLTIDVASNKITNRVTPTVCPAGTHRVN